MTKKKHQKIIFWEEPKKIDLKETYKNSYDAVLAGSLAMSL